MVERRTPSRWWTTHVLAPVYANVIISVVTYLPSTIWRFRPDEEDGVN